MIRSPEQTATIEKLGHRQPGKLNVLVSSVEDVQTESDAQKILDQAKPDWVIWAAGEFAPSTVASCDAPLHLFVQARQYADATQVLAGEADHRGPRPSIKTPLSLSPKQASTLLASRSSSQSPTSLPAATAPHGGQMQTGSQRKR